MILYLNTFRFRFAKISIHTELYLNTFRCSISPLFIYFHFKKLYFFLFVHEIILFINHVWSMGESIFSRSILICRKVSKVLLHSNGTGSLVDWMPDVPELGRLDSIEIDPGNSQPSNLVIKLHNTCTYVYWKARKLYMKIPLSWLSSLRLIFKVFLCCYLQ